MPNKSLLYIGNRLSGNSAAITTIDTLANLLREEGFTVYAASSRQNKFLRLIDMLYCTLKFSQRVSCVLIDTYSTTNFYYAVAVANTCRLLKVPYIPILHGGNLPERLKNNRALSYKLFNGAKINVAPSKYIMASFKQEGYTNLVHIPNAIEIDKYKFKQRNLVVPRLLWVRSFAEIYNPMLAIEVLEKLIQRGVEASLCMVGPDKDGSLEQCKEAALEKGLDVTFTGGLSKEEWTSLAADHDIFINTTNFDNMPVSVVEAMALGLPVISTNVGGIPFLLKDGEEAILVSSGDGDAFVDAIEGLLRNEEKVNTLTQQARKKAESFDWKIVKQLWLNLFQA